MISRFSKIFARILLKGFWDVFGSVRGTFKPLPGFVWCWLLPRSICITAERIDDARLDLQAWWRKLVDLRYRCCFEMDRSVINFAVLLEEVFRRLCSIPVGRLHHPTFGGKYYSNISHSKLFDHSQANQNKKSLPIRQTWVTWTLWFWGSLLLLFGTPQSQHFWPS